MARIAGIDLPKDKRLEVGLTYVYGIGINKSREILKATGISPDIRVKDLSEDDAAKIRDYIDKHVTVEGDLKRDVAMNIKRLTEINCYRGIRHRKNLPCRGQSTRCNAHTAKGIAKKRAAKK